MIDKLQLKPKLAVVSLHPNYYQDKIWRGLAASNEVDLIVYYLSDYGINCELSHPDFQTKTKWDTFIQLDMYKHVFLKNYGKHASDGPLARINPSVFRVLYENGFDAVLVHGYSSISAWFSVIAAKLYGINVIWRGESVLHGNEADGSWGSRIKQFVLVKLFSLCDAILFSCSGNKDFLKYYGVPDCKLYPIPCAVDNEYFSGKRLEYKSQVDDMKASLEIDEHAFVIVYVAQISARKRPIDLLKAVKLLDCDDICVLFVGDGTEKGEAEQYANSNAINARFVGYKSQTEIPQYYAVADLFVILSDYDPSPKALNEAMNFALPIIATNVIGTANDLVKHSENGFCVDVGDIVAISKYIEYLYDNRDVAKIFGQASADIVKSWNFEQDVQSIINVSKMFSDIPDIGDETACE